MTRKQQHFIDRIMDKWIMDLNDLACLLNDMEVSGIKFHKDIQYVDQLFNKITGTLPTEKAHEYIDWELFLNSLNGRYMIINGIGCFEFTDNN